MRRGHALLPVAALVSFTPTEGDFIVRYFASASTDGREATISTCGLSGQNPCGVFTVRWRN